MPPIALSSTSIRTLRRSLTVAVFAATLVMIVLAASASASQDLRSPDARDAARPSEPAPVDLRSPDARDAASVIRQAPPSAPQPSDDFEWGYLVVGGVGLVLLGGVAGMTVRRRRRLETPLVRAGG